LLLALKLIHVACASIWFGASGWPGPMSTERWCSADRTPTPCLCASAGRNAGDLLWRAAGQPVVAAVIESGQDLEMALRSAARFTGSLWLEHGLRLAALAFVVGRESGCNTSY